MGGGSARDVLVLAYHAVSASWRSDLAVTTVLLEQHVKQLLQLGYEPATFTAAVLAPPARRTLAVTFDDAYRSVLDAALPVLRRLGVKATVFVPTDFIGSPSMAWPGIDHWQGTPHEEELAALDASGLRTLSEEGWEIGSHTCSHPLLTELPADRLRAELELSRARVAEITGRQCESIAYPYGLADERVAAAAREAGYSAACVLTRGIGGRDPFLYPRVGMEGMPSGRVMRVKVHPAVRRLRSSGAWRAVDAFRAVQRATRAARASAGRGSRARG